MADMEAIKPRIMSGSYRNEWNSGTAKDRMMARTGPEMYRRRTGRKTGIFQFLPVPTMRLRSRRSWFPYLLAGRGLGQGIGTYRVKGEVEEP
jgi:hypothetical protein